MTQSLENVTEMLLEAAAKAGSDAADALAVNDVSQSIDVRDGALEHAERSEGIDIGLRVFIGQRQACVSSSDASRDTILQMAERAVAMAKEAPEDPNIGLADPSQLAINTDMTALDLCDPAEEPDPVTLQEIAARAEAAALAVEGVEQVQASSAGYSFSEVHLAGTNGFSAGYSRSGSGLSCLAISGTGTGMERDYDGDMRVYRDDMRDAEEIGTTAGERAVARVGARKPQTGSFPVLFDERISSSLIGHLLQVCSGTAIARGSSWARDLLGQQILPKGMDIIEDPHRIRTPGSKLFDGEGLQTGRRMIVEDGVLQGWTLDLATARRLGMESTANAARGTSNPPSPSLTNVALTQGTKTRDELLTDMGTGLLITSMIGSTINPNTGDYSRGANGFWVANGQITYPVNECTVAGNLKDILRAIVPANDARLHLSRVVPSLLVEGLTLAGD